jgi:AraC-like DNA-binding protein
VQLRDHRLDVKSPFYRHAFERLRSLAAEQGQLKTILPHLAKSDSLGAREAFTCLLQAVDALRMTGSNSIGCLMGNRFSLEAYGLFMFALFSARNLAHALELLCSYNPKLEHGLHVEFTEEQDCGVLRFWPSEFSALYPWMIEDWAFGSWRVVQGLCPAMAQPLGIRLTLPEPEHRHLYDQVFTCPVEFNSSENTIRLPAHQLAAQTQTQQSQVHQLLKYWLIDTAGNHPAENSRPGVSLRVYESILGRIGEDLPTQDTMAAALGTSLATLKRRLRAEGKSYRSIVDEVRMVLAYEYLVMSPMVIKEAAYLLHYDNPGNFCRAFRRWFGTTPEAFRQSPVGGG